MRPANKLAITTTKHRKHVIANVVFTARPDRRKLSFAGHVAVNVVLDEKYEIAGDPDLVAIGCATADASGELLEDLMIDAAVGAIESIPRIRRKDIELVAESVRRAVRGAANEAWGKKPIVTVFITR